MPLTIPWLLALLPSVPLVCIYLAFRVLLQSKKFEMVNLLLRGQSLQKYLEAYGRRQVQPPGDLSDPGAAYAFVQKIVSKIFWLEYSGWEYLLAISFNVLVTSAVVVLGLSCAGIAMGIPDSLTSHLVGNSTVKNIVAGGIGALVWSIYEFAERYRSGDLAADSIFRMGSRMLIVSAVGAFLATLLNERLALPTAFGIGVLPIDSIRSFLNTQTSKALKLPALESKHPDTLFLSIQGWNDLVCEKLTRAGISSVEQLACTNPFQIFLRSNLDWRVILDLCDQALLILYIGPKIESIRSLGFRSAGELAEINWSKDDKDSFSQFSYEEAIQEIASALGMEVIQVRMLMRSISEDISVSLLATLWSDDTPGHDDDEEDEAPPEAPPGDSHASGTEPGGADESDGHPTSDEDGGGRNYASCAGSIWSR